MLDMNLQFFADAEGSADIGFATESEVAESTDAGASIDAEAGQNSADEESFESLIKGRYKADYDASVKRAIDRRFKNQRDYESRINAMEPILTMMGSRYGMDVSDVSKLDLEALSKAIEDDNLMYEKEAFERGMDVETFKNQRKLENENHRLRAKEERARQEEQRAQAIEAIKAEEQALRQIYPDFDFQAEYANPAFSGLLNSLASQGVTNAMKTAYEAIHLNDLITGGMQYATKQTAEKLANSIRSGRPTENGTTRQGQAPTVSERDPRTFTRDDFARIKREAERGKKVYLH